MPVGPILFALFILVPVAEIAVLIQVGGVIGVGWTIALILSTALLGSVLIRRQGLGLIAKARAEIDRGRPPVRELFSGLCLALGGVMLLTPGFITDTLGFLLLLPPVQGLLRRRLVRGIEVRAANANDGRAHRPRPAVIEGEYETVEEPPHQAPETLDPPRGDAGPPSRGGWGRR